MNLKVQTTKSKIFEIFNFFSSVLKYSYSVCFTWQWVVSTCILLLPSSPAETNSRRAKKRLGCRAQNLLSEHFKDYISTLWVTIRFPSPPSFVQPSQDLLADCCRQFLGRRDQRQARVINPHHWGLCISPTGGTTVSCHAWVAAIEVY